MRGMPIDKAQSREERLGVETFLSRCVKVWN
jgi:hypothetical protein